MYLAEINANGVCMFVYCHHAATFSELRARKGRAQPSSISVEPDVQILTHLDITQTAGKL